MTEWRPKFVLSNDGANNDHLLKVADPQQAEIAAARRTVATYAQDAADCAFLLAALGLLPDD